MTGRVRSRDLRKSYTGSYKIRLGSSWTTYYRTVREGSWSTCTDRVNERTKDNPFDVVHRVQYYPNLWGTLYSGGLPSYVYEGLPIGAYSPKDPSSKFAYPNWASVASAAAANTNPSVPYLSLPVFLGELKDLPAMLGSIPDLIRGRGIGALRNPALWRNPKGLAKGAANANLAYRFGWKPFLSDLLAMLGFVDAVAKRLEALRDLLEGGSLKRRYLLPPQSAYENGGVLPTNSQPWVYHRQETSWKAKSWLTVRWGLSPIASLPDDPDELLKLAWRLVMGWTTFEGVAAGWELLPWSWLIDWLWNLGSWLKALNNSLPVYVKSLCYMRTCSCLTQYSVVGSIPEGFHLDGEFFQGATRKERIVLNPILALLPPFPSIPALTMGQWSILGSIFAQRRL